MVVRIVGPNSSTRTVTPLRQVYLTPTPRGGRRRRLRSRRQRKNRRNTRRRRV
jgi:hypothetical protein